MKNKFKELSHYAQKFVDIDDRKAHRFEARLRDDLYNAMAVLHLPTYEKILQKAQIITDKKPMKKVNNANVGKKPSNHYSLNKVKHHEKSTTSKKLKQKQGGLRSPYAL